MSTKVLARAAVEGRRLTVMIPGLPNPSSGYLVGMDDFHIQLAEISGESVTVSLIHKTAGVIVFSPDAFLDDEHELVAAEIATVGKPFWTFCAEHYLGRNGNKESQ